MNRLILLTTALCLAAGPLAAQGLGEAAAKERKRREEEQKKNNGPAKVVTTEDLAKVQGTTATDNTPTLAREMGGKARSDESHAPDNPREGAAKQKREEAGAPEERGGQDETTWRTKAAELRKDLREIEQKAQALEQEKSKVAGDILRSTDTNEILRLRADQQRIDEQLQAVKRELDGVRQETAQFEESARRAGVPPGWIR